jgi:glycogen operon protein
MSTALVALASPAAAQTQSPPLGAAYDAQGATITFCVYSSHATRIDLCVYAQATGTAENLRVPLTPDAATQTWSTTLSVAAIGSSGVTGTVYYGYRAWGPNWPFASTWAPGGLGGFVSDVDAHGNRFNPNKLLLDPYASEMSHDPLTPANLGGAVYESGAASRALDSGPVAPKGIVLRPDTSDTGPKPTRALKDDVIYEVHVRGLTMSDPSVPPALRGTYAGAALKAASLQALGVTAVELLPIQESQNDTNDLDAAAGTTTGMNYWGYATNDYFAPDRRYASDKSPGGPTRELKAMVKAFHDRGLKVFADVVYNHTGEGGSSRSDATKATLLSFRGLDNATYYELTTNDQFDYDDTGCGGNFNCASPTVRNLILDSLSRWRNELGFDGFRFDLAPVLGNEESRGGFEFDANDAGNVLERALTELPVRPAGGGDGADLIAEPWAVGAGTYQLGNFPAGWAEWNGEFRDTLRQSENDLGIVPLTPGQLATRIAGSSDLFGKSGRGPWSSINFVVAHDGFTLDDLVSYDAPDNDQPWPYGPSSGGSTTNDSWSHGGDPVRQRQGARTLMALALLSAGVPMIEGGDEMLRTQYGNNNAYDLDSDKNWLDDSLATTNAHFLAFTTKLLAFRAAHPALRPADFWHTDASGSKQVTWLLADASEAGAAAMSDAGGRFLAWRIEGSDFGDGAASIYVAYNRDENPVSITLPANTKGHAWYRSGDTAAFLEDQDNWADPGQEQLLGGRYELGARSVLVAIEK